MRSSIISMINALTIGSALSFGPAWGATINQSSQDQQAQAFSPGCGINVNGGSWRMQDCVSNSRAHEPVHMAAASDTGVTGAELPQLTPVAVAAHTPQVAVAPQLLTELAGAADESAGSLNDKVSRGQKVSSVQNDAQSIPGSLLAALAALIGVVAVSRRFLAKPSQGGKKNVQIYVGQSVPRHENRTVESGRAEVAQEGGRARRAVARSSRLWRGQLDLYSDAN